MHMLFPPRSTNPYQKQVELEARDWYVQAKCASTTSEHSDQMYASDDRAAKQNRIFCLDCPERLPCLEYALVTREQYGIWGGTTEVQRKNLLRTLRRHLGPNRSLEDLVHRPRIITFLQNFIKADIPHEKRKYRKRNKNAS